MRTGSDAMAPSSAARCEIDVSSGASSSPDSARAGSKRMFIGSLSSAPPPYPSCSCCLLCPSCLHDREPQLRDQLSGAPRVLVSADPQRDDSLAVVLRRRQG